MDKAQDVNLSIVIPAYNEAENIREAVETVVNQLSGDVTDYEVIVVDDGSLDSTRDIIQELACENNNVIPILHDQNRGKGAALVSGFKRAKMDWVLLLDADLQINISELRNFIPYTNEFDIVAGFRTGRKDPLSRRVFSKVYALLVRLILGLKIIDLNCPFKLIRGSLIKDVALESTGFAIDVELLHSAIKKGYCVKEIAVACQIRKKGVSTVRFKHAVESVKELAAIFFACHLV